MLEERIITSMCMTWQHDYGLLNEEKRNFIYKRMAQIFENDIKPFMNKENLLEKVSKLEDENSHLKNIIKAYQKEI